jgi:CubicO group peptidase (beta-lactamase class C family)
VVLGKDTQESLPGGTAFNAPGGWSIAMDGARALLTGPEPDLHVTIVESTIANADEAVQAAWTALHPDFKRPVKVVQPRPGRHGWEEQKNYDYETSPNERMIVFARALRHKAAWTMALIESGEAAFERRLSQVRRVGDSLRPEGYTRESFAGKTAHKLDAERIKHITDFLDHAREQAGIPGVALALVQDGKVVYEGGLGVRDLDKPAKVDAHTAFIVASNTKAMTTLMLAKLVDEKKLTWDTPVVQVLPGFKLGDADTTKQVLVKHLICACTGMPRQDYEWLFQFSESTPQTAMGSLATMHPTTKFGETFQYSNLMAAAGGYVGGHVAYPKKELGAAYDEAMQTRVFGPLGMTETTFDFKRAMRGDHATAYEDDEDGKTAPAIMDVNLGVIPVRPAGGAWSTVHDIAKMVMMELADGKLASGKQFLSKENLLARREPQVPMGEFATYGMGLMVDNEWGVPVVHHGGDMLGYHSDMFWFPEAGVGGVILTNGKGWLIRRALIRKTLEELYDGRPEAAEDAAAAIEQSKADVGAERKRLTVPPDPAVVAKLAKKYTSVALGDVDLRTDGPRMLLDVGEWKSPLATRKNDDGTTSLVTTGPGIKDVNLVVGEQHGKRTLVLRDRQHEYTFVEAP